MEIIPDKKKVVSMVEQAYRGEICLPNFQRDFVWTREEVADLIRSIMRGYFIGSLLVLRCDPLTPPFAPVPLRGSKPEHVEPKPKLLVLDGQQRLSSLMYALTAPDLSLKDSSKRRYYFVDLDLLLGEPDNDELVFDRATRELRGLDRAENQFQTHMLPCTRLVSSESFIEWLYGFEDWMRREQPQDEHRFRYEWRTPWTNAVHAFQGFETPVVELPPVDESDADGIGRVCAIFEKLNSTGVDLSVYDLLTARLYRSQIKLHDLWDEACREHSRLRDWSGGKADTNKLGVLVLRTLALLRGLDPKPRILINLDPEGFEDDWRRAAAAMERAFELVTLVGEDGFGVFNPKWLPGTGLLPVLAALRARIDDDRLDEEARSDLRRWYWSNVFMERYSSAVESKSRKDYAEMLAHWYQGEREPDVLRDAKLVIGAPTFRIRGSASYASAVYSGVFCLLALREARDWRRGETIRLQELQDHHIFPQAYLRRHQITKRADVNTIANRTLISDETNGKIKDKAPATYLADPDILPSGPSDALMAPHFLPDQTLTSMRQATDEASDDLVATAYASFLDEREADIIAEIRRVCGVPRSAALSDAEAQEDGEYAADVDADEVGDELDLHEVVG